MRSHIKFSLLILIGTFMIAGCDNQDDKTAADLTIPVNVIKVEKSSIASKISATGTLKAAQEEQMVALVKGVLHFTDEALLDFQKRTPVKKGDLIATIYNPEHVLSTRVESNKMAMEDAKSELVKQELLFKEGGVTERELQVARRSALDAKLNYESALINIEKLNLRSPINGILSGLLIAANNTSINAGTKIFTVSDYSKILLEINLPNSDLGKITTGARAEIVNYAFEDEVFNGDVITIDPTLDPQTRTFKVTVEVDNKAQLLRPGMFVKADIILEEKEDTIVIPKNAILTRNGLKRVFIAEGATARQRTVSLGIENRENVEILPSEQENEGLSVGDRLIVKGHETLRDQSKIRVRD